jgi:hypothetical protein
MDIRKKKKEKNIGFESRPTLALPEQNPFMQHGVSSGQVPPPGWNLQDGVALKSGADVTTPEGPRPTEAVNDEAEGAVWPCASHAANRTGISFCMRVIKICEGEGYCCWSLMLLRERVEKEPTIMYG